MTAMTATASNLRSAGGASQSMNQRYTNTAGSSELDDESQLTDSYIQTSQFQSTNEKVRGGGQLLDSVPPIDIRVNQVGLPNPEQNPRSFANRYLGADDEQPSELS